MSGVSVVSQSISVSVSVSISESAVVVPGIGLGIGLSISSWFGLCFSLLYNMDRSTGVGNITCTISKSIVSVGVGISVSIVSGISISSVSKTVSVSVSVSQTAVVVPGVGLGFWLSLCLPLLTTVHYWVVVVASHSISSCSSGERNITSRFLCLECWGTIDPGNLMYGTLQTTIVASHGLVAAHCHGGGTKSGDYTHG